MSLHQIIYTSCMRGIHGVNDGQQIFSYDASFNDSNHDAVKSLFTYQPPILDLGVDMTEELAATLPKSFIYRKMNADQCALALNTYLGRDYMGSAGRFGNYLSHVVLADASDMTGYPCEYYGGTLLRDHMQFEEVNNPEQPSFLPTPILEKGFVVDVDAVIDFLSVDNRMEVFKNMLHAVLSFYSQRKRVVICDDPEHVIMWIAAIEYAFPLQIAREINFSTYDFDPVLSESQICGVIQNGTHYTRESQRAHFVFDLYQNNCAEFEKDAQYFDFIDTAMSFSYDSMQDFHRFLTDGYTYRKADETIYAAYRLYAFFTDEISGLDQKELDLILSFATTYALPAEHARILACMLAQRGVLLNIDSASFLSVARYMSAHYHSFSEADKALVKELMVDRILVEFLHAAGDETFFVSFYETLFALCSDNGFTISTELMCDSNRKKLFAIMQSDIVSWKITFIVKVVSTYVTDQKIPLENLSLDTALGQTYYGLVKAVYSQSARNGFFLVACILDEFSTDTSCLMNMALNLEGMLLDLPNGAREVAAMWKYFVQLLQKSQCRNIRVVYELLYQYRRYDLMYMTYAAMMASVSDISQATTAFNHHCETYVDRDAAYAKQYQTSIICDYYEQVEKADEDSRFEQSSKLLRVLSAKQLEAPFAARLMQNLVADIPFKTPSKENYKIIQSCLEYICSVLDMPVSGKLLLLEIGILVEKCKKPSQLQDSLNLIERLTQSEGVKMPRLSSQELEQYFDWILPAICELCECYEEIEQVYSTFQFSRRSSAAFLSKCAKIYLKMNKRDKEYTVFCEYLGLVLKYADGHARGEVGKVLSKLGKKKMLDLDDCVKHIYFDNRVALLRWAEIKEVATHTNKFLDGITKLFGNKDD